MEKYPLKFDVKLVEKIWGGNYLKKFHKLNSEQVGESWILSTILKESKVLNGSYKNKSFKELVTEYQAELLGSWSWGNYHLFPLLFKFLDINDKLSIQVHPSDEYAKKHYSSFGKAEAWFILDASKDAKIIYGLKKGITRDDLIRAIKENDLTVYEVKKVKAGDFLIIKPGIVHASLAGSLAVFEVQQSSDLTFRLFDFERKFNGKKRELHLKEALEVISFAGENNDLISIKFENELIKTENFYFNFKKTSDILNFSPKKEFYTLTIIEAINAKLIYGNERLAIKAGEIIFIPPNLEISLEGEVKFIRNGVFDD